jgi:hypothetical protein
MVVLSLTRLSGLSCTLDKGLEKKPGGNQYARPGKATGRGERAAGVI